MSVFVQWQRCQQTDGDGVCGTLVNFACDRCDVRVCVWHMRIGLPPERPELCPRCYQEKRRAPDAPAAPPVPWWVRAWLAIAARRSRT